jgi:ABC-type uncharacterized transport system substrate-binding protein
MRSAGGMAAIFTLKLALRRRRLDGRRRSRKSLVALQCNVIFAHGIANVRAVQQASSTIPIVFIGVGDPTAVGLAKNYAHPGGNLTGLVSTEASVVGKWLTILKEIAPSVQFVGLIGNPKTAPIGSYQQAGDSLARTLGNDADGEQRPFFGLPDDALSAFA